MNGELDPVAAAFDALAPAYDADVGGTLGGSRAKARGDVLLRRHFRPGDRVMDIGCGTGVDAVRLARRGLEVVAVDISQKMLDLTAQRAERACVSDHVHTRCLPARHVDRLVDEFGPESLAGAYSFFGSLNLEDNLESFQEGLAGLVRPGAPVIVGLINRVPLWEWTFYPLILRPDKLARKLRRRPTMRVSRMRADRVPVRYYTNRSFGKAMGPEFRVLEAEACNVFAPPPYLERYARRAPRLVRGLDKVDERLGSAWPWRNWGYFSIVTLRRAE